jgi:acid stress-induced BolA-like protein IbaG/YrbA
MQPEEIKQLIEAGIPGSEAIVKIDGAGHNEVTVVSDAFAGISAVNKSRLVYAALDDEIKSGAIHAINIKAYTPDEWKTASKMQVS